MTRMLYILAALSVVSCSSEPAPEVIVVAADMGSTNSALDAGLVDVGETEDAGGTDAGSPVDMAQVEPPAELTYWLTGDPEDAEVQPAGPGLILMGGGVEPDEAFEWWRDLIAGGDVVVLRTSGADGYNDYLFNDIGGANSVETLLVDTVALANAPYVARRIDEAEAVFLAGGDQWTYLSRWSGTALHEALARVNPRGAVLGGTSAGLAVLGDRAFSAENDTVYSDEALQDPYNEFMRFEDDFLALPELEGSITDSHFRERDRMGRLVTFVARMWKDGWVDPLGIGVDESTALLVGPDGRSVVGRGAVYEVRSDEAPQRCEPGEPLEFSVRVTRVTADETTEHELTASGGSIDTPPYAP